MNDTPETTMYRTLPLTVLVMIAVVAACTSMGHDTDKLTPRESGVTFAWDSKDGGILPGPGAHRLLPAANLELKGEFRKLLGVPPQVTSSEESAL